MNSSRFKLFLFYYFPAFFWAGIIFYFSSIPALKVGASDISWEVVFRKIAHVGEYALLALLVLRIFLFHDVRIGRALLYTWIVGTIFAMSDEFHQTFVAERAGKVIDVLVDSLSVFLSLAILNSFYRKAMTKKRFLSVIFSLLGLVAIILVMVIQTKKDGLSVSSTAHLTEKVASDYQEIKEKMSLEKEQLSGKIEEMNAASNNNSAPEDASAEKTDLPRQVKIQVPFTSQAPLSNWDAVHEETCEEASLMMVEAYLQGVKTSTIDKNAAEKELLALVDYEVKTYGDYKDSDMQELVKTAQGYYGSKNLKVIYDFDKQEIKRQLAKGKPIILPAAGRRLGNPNFKSPGPLYHVLVATGYNGNIIITNDPGTRKGQDYQYTLDTLYSAVHDFPGKPENIEQGRKAMIVIE